ncbi:MAG: DUF4179 domain-containing protein [Lachnospiraceae bacterium]|nr:DUF4179 domain-containing protein [Lachnospiraceae bacterium]
MNQHIEYELKNIMKTDLPESAFINQRLQETYQQLNSQKKHNHSRGFAIKAAVSVAACLLLVMIWGIQNPTLAAQLPLIGRIFQQLEQEVSYPGDYSEHAIDLQTPPISITDVEDSTQSASTYRQESGDLTVTLSEVTYDSNALYLAILIENKNEFPKNVQAKSFLYLTCQGSMVYPDGTMDNFGEAYGNMPAYMAEGNFPDSHTFQGLIQFEWDHISDYSFCNFTFLSFEQELQTGTKMTGELGNSGEFVEYIENDRNIYEGEWSFEIPIDSSLITQKETLINDCNETGFGIEKIVVNDYELYAVPIYPNEENEMDYIVSIWDANGVPLDSHGDDFTRFSTHGRDISSITVYILDYYDYMNCKGENYKKQPQKAIYQQTISLN